MHEKNVVTYQRTVYFFSCRKFLIIVDRIKLYLQVSNVKKKKYKKKTETMFTWFETSQVLVAQAGISGGVSVAGEVQDIPLP